MSEKIKTLLIDDDLNLLEVVKELVEQDGDIEIIAEGNPIKALRRLEEERYDTIVCDYEMPSLDGLKLLRILRENGNETPFIMFTGKGREEVELDAFRSGASLYLQKRGGSIAVFAELQNAIRQVSKAAGVVSKYEAGLEESVRTLKSTIDSLAMGVLAITHPENRLLYFNQKFLELWGLDEKDMHLPSEQFFAMMLVKVKDPDGFVKEANRSAGDPMTISMALISLKDGRTISRTCAPLLREGRLIGRVMTFRIDVESSLELPEGSGHLFLSSSSDMTRDLVVSLNAEGRIIYTSPSFENMSGYSYNELRGKLATTFIHNDDAARIRELWFSMTKEKVFGTIEYRFLRKDGKTVWLETKGFFSYALSGEVSGATLICRDITQRKKAEEDLIASESRYRQLVELAQGGIMLVDREARVLFVNDYLANMLGRDRSDIVGRTLGQFITQDWKDANGNVVERISQPRSSFDIDMQRQDGKVHAHADFGWLKDDAGNVSGYMAFITDITPRIMAEEELKESEQKFRAFVEESAEGVAISDENGTIIEWNKSLERIFETPKEKILGISVFDFWKVFSKGMGEEYGRELQERLHGLVTRGEWPVHPEPRKLNVITPSGRPKVLQFIVFPFRTMKGYCASVLVNDVTETNRIEQERAEAEQRYRSIFENAKEIIITIDKEGRITGANQAAGAYLGRPPAGLVGVPLEKFVGTAAYRDILEKTSASWDPRPYTGEVDVMARGERKVLEISCSPMLGDGAIVGVQCIGRDVTGRRQTEMAMDLANRKISLLGDITRHDVMNKLSVLSGYVELARAEAEPQKRTEYLGRVDQAARGIQEQMQFNKRYQALGSNRPQWTKLRSVCLNRVRLVDLKDVLMEIDVDDVEVFADPMFESVIGNLLDNSIKHGGKVTHIKIGYRLDAGGLTILYQDNGVGLAPADKKNIFNWDFRGRSGHGLHFISEVLLITGITITEDGEFGKGAHFALRVPREGFRLSNQDALRDAASKMVRT